MMLQRDEQIFLNPSWRCSIPNLFFLIFALLSFSSTIFSFMIFSFMISDSTNNGKIAEVLLGSWDPGYQSRVFLSSVWNFSLRFYPLCFSIITFPYFPIFCFMPQWFVCNIILDFQAEIHLDQLLGVMSNGTEPSCVLDETQDFHWQRNGWKRMELYFICWWHNRKTIWMERFPSSDHLGV